jgi:RNA polymerase primary sigma factor
VQASSPTTTAANGDDALGSALNRALRRPLLAAEEERRLARGAQRGDVAARDRLVEGNVRLVVAVARTYRGRGVSHADLVQEGMLGLLRAVDGFDARRGNRLATYATWWIRRAMLGAVAAAPAIRLPSEANRDRAAILRTEQELTTHGRPRPSADILAARTGVPLRRIDRLRRVPHAVASLDAPVAGGDTNVIDMIADPAADELASVLERNETSCAVVAALRLLGPRARRVVELRFGFAGRTPMTYEQIGDLVGITAERSRQIEAESLRRLRALAERASLSA